MIHHIIVVRLCPLSMMMSIMRIILLHPTHPMYQYTMIPIQRTLQSMDIEMPITDKIITLNMEDISRALPVHDTGVGSNEPESLL